MKKRIVISIWVTAAVMVFGTSFFLTSQIAARSEVTEGESTALLSVPFIPFTIESASGEQLMCFFIRQYGN